MKEQDNTLKQALKKAANDGVIIENPAVEITPSAEMDRRMNAFLDSVESGGDGNDPSENTYAQSEKDFNDVGFGDALLNAFERDIEAYDSDSDASDESVQRRYEPQHAASFGEKLRGLFVPFSRRTVGVILFAVAGVILVISLISMAKTAAANKHQDSTPTQSGQPQVSDTAHPSEEGTAAPRVDGKDTDSTSQPGMTRNPSGTPGPGEFRTSAPVSGAPTSAPVTNVPGTQVPAPTTTTPGGGGGRPTNPPTTPTTGPSTDDPIVRPTPGADPTEPPATEAPTEAPVTDAPTDAPTDEPAPDPTAAPEPDPTEAPVEPPAPEEPGE